MVEFNKSNLPELGSVEKNCSESGDSIFDFSILWVQTVHFDLKHPILSRPDIDIHNTSIWFPCQPIYLNDTINTWLMVPHFPWGKNNQSRFRLDLVIQWWKEVIFEKVNHCKRKHQGDCVIIILQLGYSWDILNELVLISYM